MGRPPVTRADGLTRERIVKTAIELLDADGEGGLTFRSLALKLETGHGALQWHVANKGELMMAASVTVLARTLATPASRTSPADAIRAIALDVFNAIDAHPWLGRQLFALPWQPAMVQLWEQVGHAVEALGVHEEALFTAVSTLVNYIIGVGSQNAMNIHLTVAHDGRDAFLQAVAERWESHDLSRNSVVRRLAAQLRTHDDRAEFLASIDIILAGLTAPRRELNG